MGVSHKSVINWINKAQISKEVQRANSPDEKVADSIEIDEIYTFVKKKQQRAVVWTACSRRERKVIAYVIGEGLAAAKKLYA